MVLKYCGFYLGKYLSGSGTPTVGGESSFSTSNASLSLAEESSGFQLKKFGWPKAQCWLSIISIVKPLSSSNNHYHHSHHHHHDLHPPWQQIFHHHLRLHSSIPASQPLPGWDFMTTMTMEKEMAFYIGWYCRTLQIFADPELRACKIIAWFCSVHWRMNHTVLCLINVYMYKCIHCILAALSWLVLSAGMY